MAKRYTATELWGEDWFLDMPNEYKLFWYYMLAKCDHAGLFKVNVRSFCGLLEVKLTPNQILDRFNVGKQRVREVSESVWLIEDFFFFQYGATMNLNNRVHESIKELYERNKIDLWSIRGLLDLKDRVKDKDKDKDKSISNQKNKNEKGEFKFSGNFKSQTEELFHSRTLRNLQGQTDGVGEKNNPSEA